MDKNYPKNMLTTVAFGYNKIHHLDLSFTALQAGRTEYYIPINHLS